MFTIKGFVFVHHGTTQYKNDFKKIKRKHSHVSNTHTYWQRKLCAHKDGHVLCVMLRDSGNNSILLNVCGGSTRLHSFAQVIGLNALKYIRTTDIGQRKSSLFLYVCLLKRVALRLSRDVCIQIYIKRQKMCICKVRDEHNNILCAYNWFWKYIPPDTRQSRIDFTRAVPIDPHYSLNLCTNVENAKYDNYEQCLWMCIIKLIFIMWKSITIGRCCEIILGESKYKYSLLCAFRLKCRRYSNDFILCRTVQIY